MILVVFTTLGSVLLPKISKCKKNYDNYKKYLIEFLNYILFILIPTTIVCFALVGNIIFIMSGFKFKESIPTIKILFLILIIIRITYFIGF